MVMAISHVEQKNRNGFSTFCRAFISFLVYHFDIYHFDVYHFLDTFALCFQSVAQERGFPDQLITDKGDENRLLAFSCHAVQDNMPYAIRRPPHVVVKSVNNQRIEHGWGEVNIRITRPIREFIIHLELNYDYLPGDGEQLGALQRLLLPCIKDACASFMHVQNHRRVQGKARNEIPAIRAVEGARPGHLHRPWPAGMDFVAMYEQAREEDGPQPSRPAVVHGTDCLFELIAFQEYRRRAMHEAYPAVKKLFPLFFY